MSTQRGTQDLVIARVFDAPLDDVWLAWTESELVMQWWGPKGFTSPCADIDFREGGVSLVCMRAPEEYGGQDLYNTWTYTRIAPHKSIEFVTHFVDEHRNRIDPATIGIPPGTPSEVRSLVTFRELDGGRTELVVTEFGWAVPEAMELSRQGMEECLDKMAALFAREKQQS